MSGQDYQQRLAQAEEVRRRMVEYARQGEYFQVGEAAAQLLLAEQEEREKRAIFEAGRADALAQERERLQREADETAQQYSETVLRTAAQRLETDADFDPQNVADAAQRWRRYAEEAAKEEAGHQLSDADIARMEPEEWERCYDTERGRFKPGYTYQGGDGGGFGAVNGAAAGLSGSSLDLRTHPA